MFGWPVDDKEIETGGPYVIAQVRKVRPTSERLISPLSFCKPAHPVMVDQAFGGVIFGTQQFK
jgi:hypothetical protein